MNYRITPLYPTRTSDSRSAFYTTFGLLQQSTEYQFRVERESGGMRTGCNVASVTTCTHCSGPHLEVVSHIMESAFPATVSDAIESAQLESAIMITPDIECLAESGDTYPAGLPGDTVISRRALAASLRNYESDGNGSVIIRVIEEALSIEIETGEIRDWPYLTLEAATFLHQNFKHMRTNSPSIEKQHSQGGMWSHAIFFGLEPNRSIDGPCVLEKRTVGELFHLPRNINDGKYSLVCPFHEIGLDCALTLPFLIS